MHWLATSGVVTLEAMFVSAVIGTPSAHAQAATEAVLHSFASPPRGASPFAGVIRDSAGNLYGTTTAGGASNSGVVYKVNTAGQETVLYSFTGGADGGLPFAGVIRDSAGNLSGTTYHGGASGAGVVFQANTGGQETVLYSFTGGADGGYPNAGVIRDSAGNLYGTTTAGGASNWGVVYKLDPAGNYTVLYSFTGGENGGGPYAGVIRDPAGNLYGTTSDGGAASVGVVYKLNAAGQETVLHTFTGGADGSFPNAGVIRDSSGNLYGTTSSGGTANAGVVYTLDAAGRETVLYSFTGGADGSFPYAGVIRDSAGNLYGTTLVGGPAELGEVFELDAAGNETVLFSFPGPTDGEWPTAGVIRDPAGNLYGTTEYGGRANAGVVYKVNTAGREKVLYSFTGGADGSFPYAGVIRDSAGNLYGTTTAGGASNSGVVYKVNTAGQETVLYSFTGAADGGLPFAGVIRDSAGNLYGTTTAGGASNSGVVYKVNTAGQETVLYSFGAGGSFPYAGVIPDSAGNFYGTTSSGGTANAGVVYKLDPAGNYTVLYSFTLDGGYPRAGVIRDSVGNLYGTTSSGGTANAGVVYMLDTAGRETVLYSFTGYPNDGGQPYAGVIRDSAGNLYGTTYDGGTSGAGVVYKLKP
jgi:uncharacterized repeat protein (TIGR03803 family)